MQKTCFGSCPQPAVSPLPCLTLMPLPRLRPRRLTPPTRPLPSDHSSDAFSFYVKAIGTGGAARYSYNDWVSSPRCPPRHTFAAPLPPGNASSCPFPRYASLGSVLLVLLSLCALSDSMAMQVTNKAHIVHSHTYAPYPHTVRALDAFFVEQVQPPQSPPPPPSLLPPPPSSSASRLRCLPPTSTTTPPFDSTSPTTACCFQWHDRCFQWHDRCSHSTLMRAPWLGLGPGGWRGAALDTRGCPHVPTDSRGRRDRRRHRHRRQALAHSGERARRRAGSGGGAGVHKKFSDMCNTHKHTHTHARAPHHTHGWARLLSFTGDRPRPHMVGRRPFSSRPPRPPVAPGRP